MGVRLLYHACMIVADVIQGSEEWFAARCGVVTASNFGRVLTGGAGKTRASYMRLLEQEILTGARAASYENEHMNRGRVLEPRARKAYEALTGRSVREVGIVYLDGRKRIAASPDGLIGEDGGLEIKCPLPKTHYEYLCGDAAPARYKAQIQGNLWVTGRQWWDFVSHAPEESASRRTVIFRVHRDESYIQLLKTEVMRFVEELDGLVSGQRKVFA